MSDPGPEYDPDRGRVSSESRTSSMQGQSGSLGAYIQVHFQVKFSGEVDPVTTIDLAGHPDNDRDSTVTRPLLVHDSTPIRVKLGTRV